MLDLASMETEKGVFKSMWAFNIVSVVGLRRFSASHVTRRGVVTKQTVAETTGRRRRVVRTSGSK